MGRFLIVVSDLGLGIYRNEELARLNYYAAVLLDDTTHTFSATPPNSAQYYPRVNVSTAIR